MPVSDTLFENLPPGSLKILQITDTHLYADRLATLMGVNTDDTLRAVLAELLNGDQPDLVLATGDLVHDASETGYQRFAEAMQAFSAPVYCLPGNHDDALTMQRHIITDRVFMQNALIHSHWQIIMLDSAQPGSANGCLAENQLAILQKQLAAHGKKHTLVCLHHNPVTMNSEWLDSMTLENHQDFFKIIDAHPQVRGILWGHVHQEYDNVRNNVQLMGSPSTCVQFEKQSEKFGLDALPPGWRWLALLPDGTIRTRVSRLQTIPEGLSRHGTGYN